MNLVQFILVCLAGWIHRHQQHVIEYLQEEVKVLKEQLGKRPRFNDDQRRLLATQAKKVGLPLRGQIAAIVTPRTLLDWHQPLPTSNSIANPPTRFLPGSSPCFLMADFQPLKKFMTWMWRELPESDFRGRMPVDLPRSTRREESGAEHTGSALNKHPHKQIKAAEETTP